MNSFLKKAFFTFFLICLKSVHKIIIFQKNKKTMTVILCLLFLLVTQGSAFTPDNSLLCNSDTTRVNKSPIYTAQIIPFDEDVYQIGTNTVQVTLDGATSFWEVILFRNGDLYAAHGVGPDLTIYNQTYTSPTPTQLLDVIEHIIFVKEFSADMQSFNYAAYFFDKANPKSTSLKRIVINPMTFATQDPGYGLKFNKALQYDDQTDTLYVVMTNSKLTQYHSKKLDADGAFGNAVTIQSSMVNITVGNTQLLFDDSSNSYYKFKAAGQSYDKVAIKTSTTGTFGPILTSNFQYYRLFRGNFAITSYTGSSGSISASFGLFNDAAMIASGQDTTATGSLAPVVHFNKFNFIFISETLFSFCRYNSQLKFSSQNQDSTILTASQLTEAKGDFRSALRVAFNAEKQFILSDSSIVIYELAYNTDGSTLTKINKLSTIALASDVTTELQSDTGKWIKLRIQCQCSKIMVTKLKCFSNRFKCLGINTYIPQDCTIPYVDTVPQFA